jgi:DNA ligase-1
LSHTADGELVAGTKTRFRNLFLPKETDLSKPYPFYLAYALEEEVHTLGDPSEWIAERKWDGIRGQIIVRKGQLFVWSRGEELVTDKYPEYQVNAETASRRNGIDGEILPFKDDLPMSFNFLQTRIGRKTLSQKILKDVPVSFVTYDVLEWNGRRYPELEDLKTEGKSSKRSVVCNIRCFGFVPGGV